MKRLLNQVRIQAQAALSDRSSVKTGLVSGYDATNYSVKVTLQPENIETGWLPLLSPWVGNGWGMFCAPSIGDMVEVQFEQGGAEAAFACMRFYNNTDRPLSVPSGEFWLVHKLGQSFKLTNDGKVTVTDKAGSVIVMNGDGTGTVTFGGGLTINANTTINGNVQVSGTITAPNVVGTTNVTFGGKSGVGHVHSDPQGGTTGAPV